MGQAAAAARAGSAGAPSSARHRPEQTLLSRIVAQHYPAFVELLAGQGRPLPDYVQQELHLHMLFLDGVYVEGADGALAFRWVKAPTGAELTALAGRIASRVGRFLERQGLLERDAESPCLSELALEGEPMEALLAHSITYRIAVGPRAGRKVFTLAAPAGRR